MADARSQEHDSDAETIRDSVASESLRAIETEDISTRQGAKAFAIAVCRDEVRGVIGTRNANSRYRFIEIMNGLLGLRENGDGETDRDEFHDVRAHPKPR